VQAGVYVVGVLERYQSEVYRKGVLQEKDVKTAQKQQNTLLIEPRLEKLKIIDTRISIEISSTFHNDKRVKRFNTNTTLTIFSQSFRFIYISLS
jgi:transaldolase